MPFEDVPDLVATRRVPLVKGQAYVQQDQVCRLQLHLCSHSLTVEALDDPCCEARAMPVPCALGHDACCAPTAGCAAQSPSDVCSSQVGSLLVRHLRALVACGVALSARKWPRTPPPLRLAVWRPLVESLATRCRCCCLAALHSHSA